VSASASVRYGRLVVGMWVSMFLLLVVELNFFRGKGVSNRGIHFVLLC
jgi:hypothetical protein